MIDFILEYGNEDDKINMGSLLVFFHTLWAIKNYALTRMRSTPGHKASFAIATLINLESVLKTVKYGINNNV